MLNFGDYWAIHSSAQSLHLALCPKMMPVNSTVRNVEKLIYLSHAVHGKKVEANFIMVKLFPLKISILKPSVSEYDEKQNVN